MIDLIDFDSSVKSLRFFVVANNHIVIVHRLWRNVWAR